MVTCNCPNCGGTKVYITPKNVYVDTDDPELQDRMMEDFELEDYYVSKKSGRAFSTVMGIINFFCSHTIYCCYIPNITW